MKKLLVAAALVAALALPARGERPLTPRETQETIETVNRIAAGRGHGPLTNAFLAVPGWIWAASAIPTIYALRRMHYAVYPRKEKR